MKISQTTLQRGQRLMDATQWLGQPYVQPDSAQFAALLRKCSHSKALAEGMRVHGQIIRLGQDKGKFLGNLLIEMYGKCSALGDARSVFDKMHLRNAITWTLVIGAYAEHGDHMEAFHIYQQMQREGVEPSKITFVRLLSACSITAALAQGKEIHASIVQNGFDSDVLVGSAIINMYRKCGCLESARRIFDSMRTPDVIAWNTIISACVQYGEGKDSMHLYQQMQQDGVKPNKVTFISILGACYCPAELPYGKDIHRSIVDTGFESDVVVGTALVNMYGKCRRPEDARKVFDRINGRNVISWNAMISVYVCNSHDTEALSLYKSLMEQEVTPDNLTFVNVLSACATLTCILSGKEIHSSIVKRGLESEILVGTALFNMYGKCGSLKNARRVFDRLPVRDRVTWNAMLSAYVQNGHNNEALQLHQQMLGDDMIPDKFTFNTLLSACSSPVALAQGKKIHASIVDSGLESEASISAALVSMYSKCGSVEYATSVFKSLHGQDVNSWNAMLAAYVQHEHGKEALQLYQEMVENGVKPDEFSFSAILGACSTVEALIQGKGIHTTIVNRGFDSDVAVSNALLNMYAKCGDVEDAFSVFAKMREWDIISWNAVLAAYAQNGLGDEVLQLYQQMQGQGMKANDVTFISVFCACSHTGLVDEALKYFDSMNEVHGIIPTLEHYACIVDLYGRVGRLKEAREFIKKMPIQPDAVVWKGLLGACRVHNDVEQGQDAAKHVVELDSGSATPYVLLSNIHAAHWGGADEVMCTALERCEDLATLQCGGA